MRRLVVTLGLCLIAAGVIGVLCWQPPPPVVPYDCAALLGVANANCDSRIADLDKKCTDAMARQVEKLQACEAKCPEPEATP